MSLVLVLLDVVLLAAAVAFLVLYQRERAERKRRSLAGAWPIPAVSAEEIDPAFRPGPFGPGPDAEVSFIGMGPFVVEGGTSDVEAWMLAVLAKRAHRLFEFGTCTGKTAYLWARNAPADARVTTLTLPPEARSAYRSDAADDPEDTTNALSESGYTTFLYSGTPVEGKIEQLFGDSKALDVARWAGRCDLVFVDGSHAYSYVVSDSEKALQLAAPGGLVLWHDYAGPRHAKGVFRALNELAQRLPLVRIEGTTLVAYRKPA
jgi:predicted O-methyltransferase YrrM